MKSRILWVSTLALIVATFTASNFVNAQQSQNRKKGVIVRASKPYDGIKTAIRALGGDITYEYENIDAIAASVPEKKLAAVAALAGAGVVYKDVVVKAPERSTRRKGVTLVKLNHRGARTLSGDQIGQLRTTSSNISSFNNPYTGAASLHQDGHRGQDVVVAVVDSGVANAPDVTALAGSVIGGESFLSELPSATSTQNDPHGTQVASMIAAHGSFVFNNDDPLVQSLLVHDPNSVIPCTPSLSCGPNQSIVPMIGAAPEAKIYAIKIFPAGGGGTTKATLLAAMDRLISIRRKFNRTGRRDLVNPGCGAETNPCKYDSLDIQVVNMSLGTVALFAGQELEDELTERMLNVGMTPVAAAGNDGFAAMTGSAPGTGFGALTVGAASTVLHERVSIDIDPFWGLGLGILFRPNNVEQTLWYSSRGPTADGRIDPELVANGMGNYAQGPDGFPTLVAGTSFSTPAVSGAAALLLGAVRAGSATATEVRNALAESASRSVLKDGSGAIDQGNGFLDIPAALRRLRSGRASSGIERSDPTSSVAANIKKLGFDTVRFENNRFSTRLRNLRPGEVRQFFVQTKDETNQLTVSLRNLDPVNDFSDPNQNQLFGDDLVLMVSDAPTSFSDTLVNDFVFQDSTFVIDEPQTGLVRVAVQGDTTNAGLISATLVIERRQRPLLPESAEGRISDKELIEFRVQMPPGKSEAVFELFWDHDWSSYPTNDVDMILCQPGTSLEANTCNKTGATLASPERVVISNPQPGAWKVYVHGFTVHTRSDDFKLRVSADGQRLSAR